MRNFFYSSLLVTCLFGCSTEQTPQETLPEHPVSIKIDIMDVETVNKQITLKEKQNYFDSYFSVVIPYLNDNGSLTDSRASFRIGKLLGETTHNESGSLVLNEGQYKILPIGTADMGLVFDDNNLIVNSDQENLININAYRSYNTFFVSGYNNTSLNEDTSDQIGRFKIIENSHRSSDKIGNERMLSSIDDITSQSVTVSFIKELVPITEEVSIEFIIEDRHNNIELPVKLIADSKILHSHLVLSQKNISAETLLVSPEPVEYFTNNRIDYALDYVESGIESKANSGNTSLTTIYIR